PAAARHIILTDSLPAALLNPVVLSSGAAVTLQPGSRLVWDVSTLAVGQGGAITVTGTISPAFTGVLTNTAHIDTVTVDSDPANNTGAVVHTVVPHRLFLPLITRNAGP
ncbi:MAG: hypothetical protein P1S60_16710, partial [Anaerolineae bacterium]|nr:hypothetical protein [Anaerolineae bacterium]